MLGNSVDKYVTGTMIETSNDRRWSHIQAERWRHEPGELPSLTPRDTEIAVLLQGRSIVDRIGSGMRQTTHAHRGTTWLCPAGVEEEFIDISAPMADCLHIFLPARPFDDTILRDLDVEPSRVELRYEVVAQDTFIEHVAGCILEELAQETAAGRLLIETLAVALSAHLVHKYSAVDIRSKVSIHMAKPLDAKRLARVEDFIESNLCGDFTVADLASVACMSVAHFARSFRAATGKTPYEFVSGQRLELARRRLIVEDTQIAEIAAAAGFSSQANFTRAFRKAIGMTPAQMRVQGRHS